MQTSGSNSGAPSQVPSPTAARRMEEQRRAEDNYRPSAAAHHPQSMQNIMHKEPEKLPPINSVQNGTTSAPPSRGDNTPDRVEDQVQKKEEPEQRSPKDKRDADGDVRMRAEEPAMRKMDVNEDYDDGSDDDSSKTKGADGPKMVSGEQSRGSPKSSGPPSATTETPNSAKPESK